MARVYVLSGPELGRTHDFTDALVIGRGADADLRLKAGSVSRRHARVRETDEGWELEDLGSSNGTRMDGQLVEHTVLRDGDVFLLGDVELRFRSAEGLGATAVRARPAAAPPAEAPPRAPEPEPEPAPADDDGIELEGDWSEEPAEASLPLRAGPKRAPAPQPAPARPAAKKPSRAQRQAEVLGRRVPDDRVQDARGGRPVLQFQKVEARRGLLAGDVGQQPTLVRYGLYLLALAVFAALAYGAYRMTTSVREARGGPAPVDGGFDDGGPGDGYDEE